MNFWQIAFWAFIFGSFVLLLIGAFVEKWRGVWAIALGLALAALCILGWPTMKG